MQDFELKNKTNRVYVAISTLSIHVTIGESQSDKSNIIVIEKSKEIYNKLKSYKSVSALLKYAKANALPSPNTSLDLPSEASEVEGNPPPVAVSVPTASDTPFIPIPSMPTRLCDDCFDTPREGEALCNACKIRKIMIAS